MAIAARGIDNMAKKISISAKRQLTIPQQYFEELGFGSEAVCELKDNGIFIRPVKQETSGEFDEFILADLIEQGYEGKELLSKFKDTRKQIRPAVQKMLEESRKLAESNKGKLSFDELFGSEDK
jgi:bifunctional DNA-binding transcriptional regulator/antitoxin component of YhaV-PrlF toxin-antitoxin module